jgi:hypothetical protein
MAIVNGSLELGYKNLAWFNANPTLVLKEGQIVYLQQTGTYKIGNGTSTLSALSFLGISSETQTLQNVTDLGATTTNSITANGFVKTGGTASQFLKANGSVDSSTYASTTYVDNQDALKVDKVVGKGLSTNDYTTAEQTKLAGIATGAEVNVNADWNATSGDAQILNKPTIPTQVVPVGGTTGQILAKVDDTDYNLEWIENYANYTSVLKHTVKASVALTKGQAVYVSGASGTNMLVSKASNVSEPTSSKTLGLIAQNLAINGQGFVITEGLLSGLNTNSATIGDAVWLGVDGALIYGLASKPYAPAHLVFIGIVTRVSATVGEIFVKVQNGFELKEIHDVDLITTTPINGHLLGYNGTLWVNKTIASWLGYTPYDASNPSAYISGITSGNVTTALGFTPYNSTNPSGYITGITSGDVTTALGFTPYNATNPDGYITSSALTPYAPLSNPTFTTAITTPLTNSNTVAGANTSGGNLLIISTNNATKGSITIGNNNAELVYLGNQQFAFTNVFLYGASNANSFLITRVTASDTAPVYVTNRADSTTGIGGALNKVALIANGLTRFSVNGVTTSGATNSFTLTKPDNTNQTLSTSIAGWNYNGGTRQWATGNITTQSEIVWGATTYSFVGASTITNAFGNVFNAPVAGTNCTITNPWAAQFNGNVVIGSTGQLIEIKQTTNNPTYVQTGATSSVFRITSGTKTLAFESYAGDNTYLSSTGGAFSIRTTDAQGINFFTTNTLRMVIGGTGNILIKDANNLIFESTSGTKIATATNQKIAFWNSTPIVQPTTSVTASTFVANTSLIANDTATFDGYTIGQVVKALRNMGLLA